MFVILMTVALLALLISSLTCYLSWNFNYWSSRHVAGPQPQLLKGTFPKTNAGQCNLLEELNEIYLRHKATHKFVGVYMARSPKLFILDPELATEILTHHFQCFRNNESSLWTTGRVEQMRVCSPFVATDDDWKQRRAELVPALSSGRVRAFFTGMRESAKKLVAFMAPQTAVAMDAKELANRFTAEFMASFIWGIEARAFSRASPSTIQQVANRMIPQALACVRYFGRTAAWPWLRLLRPMRFFPATFDNFFKQLAMDSLALRAKTPLERSDVINHLLQLKQKKDLSDTQIAGHTTTVLIDGYETGAVLIAHCLLLLARNDRVQQKLRQELVAIGPDMSYDALMELPYLEQCIQETLRLFPPLPTLFKLCTETITLKDVDGTELRLDPGIPVYISSYSFHRDSDYYADPEAFWPERFDAELGGVRKYRNLGVFLPFGLGPRMCPGMKLGLAEAKVAVSEVVCQFNMKCIGSTRTDNKIADDSFLLTLDGKIELIFQKL